jgi:predicted ATPase with chaperone activity
MTAKEFLETFYKEPLHIADIFEMEEVLNVMDGYAKEKVKETKKEIRQMLIDEDYEMLADRV